MSAQFTWINIYQELADELKGWEPRQQELIAILEDLRAKGRPIISLLDRDSEGNQIPFEEIDPFTFFGVFNRGITDENRRAILADLKETFDLGSPVPQDFTGIPVLDNRSSWFFAWKYQRTPDDVPRLWRVFRLALGENPLEDEDFWRAFDDALQVKRVNINLTMGLFWIRPHTFLSLDKVNRDYLGITLPRGGLTSGFYRQLLADMASRGESFPELSLAAWRLVQKPSPKSKATDATGPTPPTPPSVPAGAPQNDAAFSAAAFELLEALHQNPTRQFYLERKDAFVTQVEQPFQALMHAVAQKLPLAITSVMETEKRIFSRILKNDFGQGGAWDFYWGAFYPAGSKRTEDAQLSMWINHRFLEFGFYIADYATDKRQRFAHNCRRHPQLVAMLRDAMPDWERFVVGRLGEHFEVDAAGQVVIKQSGDMAGFLADPESFGFDVSFVKPKAEVLATSSEALVEEIVRVFIQLFPLVLLATEEEPLPAIARYLTLEEEDEPELNPEYPLDQMAEETGFSLDALERWVRAVERKGQAIFYGPPGTGKTYVAERLAQHLVGGGDGFVELVQFHPAYAYEDFIQGIRPESDGDRLRYPLKPGRFLDFITRAQERSGTSVLIIDEINRANLARVFGELMYLLEYRDRQIPLAGGGYLRIPDNVHILGTMNTADRSIALVDHALRRRFAFLALWPDMDILRRYHQRQGTGFALEGLITVLRQVNDAIGDRHYHVGVTFFLRTDLGEQVEDIWRMEIEPYLEEYFFDQPDRVDSFRWERIGPKVLSNG